MKTLTTISLLIFSQLSFAQYNLGFEQNSPSKTSGSRPTTERSINRNNVIFHEDFANGLNGNNGFGAWTNESFYDDTITYPKTPPGWEHDFDGTNGDYSPGTPLPEFPTADNGYMIFDTDLWHTPFNYYAVYELGASLISPVVDLSNQPYVSLTFHQSYRFCCSSNHKLLVELSTNGGLTYDFSYKINEGIGANVAVNNEKFYLDLTDQIANQDSVRFKFTWPEKTASHYYWAIDDVSLHVTSDNDIELVDVFVVTDSTSTYEYHQLPKNLANDNLYITALVKNYSKTDKYVKLQTTYEGNTTPETTQLSDSSFLIKKGEMDTIITSIDNNWNVDDLQFQFTALTDSSMLEDDEYPIDNTKERTISIDNTLSFNEISYTSNSVVDNQFYSVDSNYLANTIVTTRFTLFDSLQVDSISIAIDSAIIGAPLEWAIIEVPNNINSDSLYSRFLDSSIVKSANYTLVNNALVNKGVDEQMLGYKAHLPFYDTIYNGSVELVKKSVILPGDENGKEYMVGIIMPAATYISLKQDNLHSRYFDQYQNSRITQSYGSGYYIKRLIMELNTTTHDATSTIQINNNNTPLFYLGQSRPNPSNNVATISYQLNNNSNKVALSLVGIAGKEILHKPIGNQAAGSYDIQIATTDIPNGIYFYTLSVGNQKLTRKLVVNH